MNKINVLSGKITIEEVKDTLSILDIFGARSFMNPKITGSRYQINVKSMSAYMSMINKNKLFQGNHLKKNLNKSETIRLIMSEIKQISVQLEISSFHILYPDPKEKTAFKNSELSLRTNNSFHWFNKGYKKFENFLDDFTSRQRKNVKKERDKIKKQGLTMVRFLGPDITEEMWDIFYLFYKQLLLPT